MGVGLGSLALGTLAAWVGFFASSAAAQPVIGPAFDVAPHEYVPKNGWYTPQSIGFNQGQYLVVGANNAQRVLADGTVIDRPGTSLGEDCGESQVFPSGSGWEVWCLGTRQRHAISAEGELTATLDVAAEHGLAVIDDVARNGELWLAVGARAALSRT